ncbi:hypothetical protein [Pantoea ananatis]|uniref:hypothetical protein n=1 Tax=Pantoea ananas TaxID=553 RepID=UPI001F4E46DB|nr:hypothetical protein [Pantoea ananatis]MCH9267717.1 hypothetical protein [Pantoea ananatis]
MDARIYMNVFTSIELNDFIIKASQTEDTVGTVLRVHLVCEKMIEGWICGTIRVENFFIDDGKQIIIDCNTKIKLARNAGMPDSLCKAFKAINALRNDIAHNPTLQQIPDAKIESIRAHLDNHLAAKGKPLSENHYIKTSNSSSHELANVTFQSQEPSNKLKLCLALNILVGEVVSEVAARNKNWDNDFRQK